MTHLPLTVEIPQNSNPVGHYRLMEAEEGWQVEALTRQGNMVPVLLFREVRYAEDTQMEKRPEA